MIYLTALLFNLGQLGRISFLNQEVNIYAYELFIFFHLLFLVIKYRFLLFKTLYKKYKLYLAFLLIVLITPYLTLHSRFSLKESIIGSLYLMRLFVYFSYFRYLFYDLKTNKSKISVIKKSLLLLIICVGIISATQYLFFPSLWGLKYQGWDPHLYRVFGTFFDTYLSGAVLGLVVMFIIDNYFESYYGKFAFIIFLLLFIGTFSRAAFLSLFLSLIFMFSTSKRFKNRGLFFIGILLLSIFIFVLYPKPFGEGVNLYRSFSVVSREKDYSKGIKTFKKHLLFGVGYDRLRYERKSGTTSNSHALSSFHSSYLTILSTTGVLGFILFVYFIYLIWAGNFVFRKYLFFVLIFSFFDNVILHAFIIFVLGILFLWTYSYKKRLR